MKRKLIIEIISSLFILLFVYTAYSKLSEFNTFRFALLRSPIIRDNEMLIENVSLIARSIPIVELMVVALLFIPRTRSWGLYGSLALMTFFTIYLGYMIYFTPNLPCSCGGVLKQMTWKQHLVFNVFFLLLALSGIVLDRNQKRREKEQEPPPVER